MQKIAAQKLELKFVRNFTFCNIYMYVRLVVSIVPAWIFHFVSYMKTRGDTCLINYFQSEVVTHFVWRYKL